MDTGLRRYDECFNCSLKKSTAIKYPLMAKVNFCLSGYGGNKKSRWGGIWLKQADQAYAQARRNYRAKC